MRPIAGCASSERRILGLDAGSVSVGLVLADGDGRVLATHYRPHEGAPRAALLAGVERLGLRCVEGVSLTGSSLALPPPARTFDPIVCLISAVRRLHRDAGALLFVGGERFGLVRFDEEGNYLDLRSSTSCAAGSGSFLDQQARRLGLPSPAALAEVALENHGPTPDIASRCSVFAKTDIIHAQAMGYSLAEICDGLCLGLARNIHNTVVRGSSAQDDTRATALCGGAALNLALRRHLEAVGGLRIIVDELAQLYGAYGACLETGRDAVLDGREGGGVELGALLAPREEQREYYFAPLQLRPQAIRQQGEVVSVDPAPAAGAPPIEVTIYSPLEVLRRATPVTIGIDIGSTSTKLALLLDERGPLDQRVLLSLYTQTGGQPMQAVCSLFARLEEVFAGRSLGLRIAGVATTGSGRKFVGKVIGADLVIDEISAHARAAYEIDPLTDTIIEIGGQDSKFTTMRAGYVTFCQMNTVCAAGTGSFLEEQAARLEIPLCDFEEQAVGVRAPLTSNRCTVFMERDINTCLGRGYSRREMLAASARSVCENYLATVAVENSIGERICFQGATARNGALVAAFEARLGKPVKVSRYCHLTGAIGAALAYGDDLARTGPKRSSFRGLGLSREAMEISVEECRYCTNHCRIRVTEARGEKVAYGFACGREYETKHYVAKRPPFDLLRERRRVFESTYGGRQGSASSAPSEFVGLPDALAMHEDLEFWRLFFAELRIETVRVDTADGGEGRKTSGADFCAPMIRLHSQIEELARKVQWIFLPVSIGRHPALRSRDGKNGAKFCYYTQFASTLGEIVAGGRAALISPTFRSTDSLSKTLAELARTLRPLGRSAKEVEAAYQTASRAASAARERLVELMRRGRDPAAGAGVLLIGRPYLVLSHPLNRGIPDYFAALGVRAFYQDMVPPEASITPDLGPLAERFQWHYSVEMLRAADYCAHTEGLYPVLVTAFKCSPDSFFIEYFKRLLDREGKPYLILQLDDLDSAVGYETRIEAAVRAFRNHRARSVPPQQGRALPVVPRVDRSIGKRTLLLPNWDPICCPLLAANLRRAGFDARVLEEDQTAIRKAMRFNTGQCIPLNIIASEFVDYVTSHELDPREAALWMPRSELACNFSFFAPYMKSLLERYGAGLGEAGVYSGEIYYLEISPLVALRAYFAYLAGGMLRRLGCRTRPYESLPGATDAVMARGQGLLVEAFEGVRPIGETLRTCTALLESVPLSSEERWKPKVAIFGDLYVRDNETLNHNLIGTIERAGGEAVTTPYNEYLKVIARAYFRNWMSDRKLATYVEYRGLLAVVESIERRFAGLVDGYHLPRLRELARDPEAELATFHLRLQQEGESFDNVLKILHLLRTHPDISLFVQASPAFCCPSLVTEAMSSTIQHLTGIPIVTITYDGTGDINNDLVVPYLAHTRGGRSAC